MIWLCFRPDRTADMFDDIARWKDHLSLERLQKMYSYRMLSDQWLCAAAYRLLQRGLFNEYGIAENSIQIGFSPTGKPFLNGVSNIHFNISHCDIGAVCALSNQKIGVDIDSFFQPKRKIMRNVLNEDEYESIISSQSPDKAFIRFWTLKESWLKATGFGLAYDPKELSVNLTSSLPYISQDRFIAKIAWENEKGCIAQCSKEGNLLSIMCCKL